jgi:hypothetical protein
MYWIFLIIEELQILSQRPVALVAAGGECRIVVLPAGEWTLQTGYASLEKTLPAVPLQAIT